MLSKIWNGAAFGIDATTAGLFLSFIALAAFAIAALRTVFLNSKKPTHLQEVVIDGPGNLTDEVEPIYDKSEDDKAQSSVRVKALCIHPIKSCRPIEVQRALLTKTGFAYDRCFAFALEKTPGDWKFLSQRTKPGMALIEQHLWLPHARSDLTHENVKTGGCLVVTFPDPDPAGKTARAQAILEQGTFSAQPQTSFMIPLKPTPGQVDKWGLRIKAFTVQERTASGLDYGDIPEVAAALPKLRKFLQISGRENLTLMACTPDTLAPTDTNLAPLKCIGTPAMQCYTDEQPLHIINLPSVHATSQLLPTENQPLSARRFRPNIFITGAPAFSEESWKRFRVLPRAKSGGRKAETVPSMSVVCRTARCTMPNVDPQTGSIAYENAPAGRKRGKPQPSTTLAEHRMVEDKQVNPIALGYMGVHCVPEDSTFSQSGIRNGRGVYVEVGDEIEVFETGNHYWGSTAHDY
ncbi:hypothetical protein Q7P37_009051 [Cladosporium fusiforme]